LCVGRGGQPLLGYGRDLVPSLAEQLCAAYAQVLVQLGFTVCSPPGYPAA
jgi:hypothetical protein